MIKWTTLFEVTNHRHVKRFNRIALSDKRWSALDAHIYISRRYPEIAELRHKGEIKIRTNGSVLQFGIETPDEVNAEKQ